VVAAIVQKLNRAQSDRQVFQSDPQFLRWLAGLMCRCNLDASNILKAEILTYDSSWFHHVRETSIAKYALLHLFPHTWEPVDVETSTIFWAHGTTTAGLQGILTDRKMLPTRKFYADQPEPFVSFMCLAAKLFGTEYDKPEKARVIRKTINLPKNRCNIIVVGYATGKCSTVDQGGAWQSLLDSKQDGVVHDRRTKRWAVRCDVGRVLGVAFAENASPGFF
jgi:hypothetical protein